MSNNLARGLRSLRNEMEKVAVSVTPLTGAIGGFGGGVLDAIRRGSGSVDELARIRAGTSALDDAGKAAFTAKNKNIADLMDNTGKLQPLTWGNKGAYAKAFLPDAAKTMAAWTSTGALAGVAAKGAKDYRRMQALKTYGPAAAAGLAGLAGYKAMRD
jgi:hypothetical protein